MAVLPLVLGRRDRHRRALLAAGERGVPQATTHVIRAITRWYRSCPDNLDDALAPGRAIIDLAATGRIPAAAAHRFIHAIDRLPTTADGIPLLEPHRPAFRFGVCIDAVYHLPPALAADGRRRSDTRQIRRAVTMAGNIMGHLACHGGWAQWYDAAIDWNNAMVWSRGPGWALLGLLDLAQIAAGTPGVNQCVDTTSKIMALLSATIDDDGTWPSLLHDPVLSASEIGNHGLVLRLLILAGFMSEAGKERTDGEQGCCQPRCGRAQVAEAQEACALAEV